MLASFLVGSRVYIDKIDQIFHRTFKGLTFLEKNPKFQRKKALPWHGDVTLASKVKYLEIELKLKTNGNWWVEPSPPRNSWSLFCRSRHMPTLNFNSWTVHPGDIFPRGKFPGWRSLPFRRKSAGLHPHLL